MRMPGARSTPRPTRRRLLAIGGGIGIGALLPACGGEDAGDAGSGSGDQAWRFTDDRGETAKAAGTPERIVAYTGAAAALYDFGIECTGVFGPTKLPNGKPDMQAGSLDVDEVTILGNTYGQFNLEKYAELRPQLLVTSMTRPPSLWYVPEESADKIEALAPTVGIRTAGTSLRTSIGRYAQLAESLGADLKAAQAGRAKARFEKASESLRTTAGAHGGIRVLAAVAGPELFYAGVPDDFADLRYFKELGVEFVTPAHPGKEGFWEEVSWENADRYDADVILLDRRTGNLQPDQLAKTKPTWRKLPAVQAGQVVPWQNEAPPSYARHAPLIESLAASLRDARQVRG